MLALGNVSSNAPCKSQILIINQNIA